MALKGIPVNIGKVIPDFVRRFVEGVGEYGHWETVGKRICAVGDFESNTGAIVFFAEGIPVLEIVAVGNASVVDNPDVDGEVTIIADDGTAD